MELKLHIDKENRNIFEEYINKLEKRYEFIINKTAFGLNIASTISNGGFRWLKLALMKAGAKDVNFAFQCVLRKLL